MVPAVEKEATPTVQNADGTWTVVHTVIVIVTLLTGEESNPEGLGAEYELTDPLDFGDGLDVIGAAWTGPGDTSGELRSGQGVGGHRLLRPRGAHRREDRAARTPAPDGIRDVSHLVAVPNAEVSDHPLGYRLTDAPADLPEGVDLVEGTTRMVSDAQDGTPGPVEADRPDEGEWLAAEGTLAPGESHAYLISARVTVAQGTTFGFVECGDVGATGIVLPNLAALGSGVYRADDEGCTTVLPSPSWNLRKPLQPPAGSTVAAGSVITYTLTVTVTVTVTDTGQVPVEGPSSGTTSAG